jgi:hypothetical protein
MQFEELEIEMSVQKVHFNPVWFSLFKNIQEHSFSEIILSLVFKVIKLA